MSPLLDERFMREALKLASRARGNRTSPNPAVGAVIVLNNRVVASGWHRRAGEAHAEVLAFADAESKGIDLRKASLYVTLEPCAHAGRTPPCTAAVIATGIKRVVVGSKDPNPKVSGRGVRALRRAGIEVLFDVLDRECLALNAWYVKYITTGLPYVTLKLATTLDGKIATSTGEARWITGKEARRHAHSMRAASDAVLVGSGTAVADDPSLTVRHVSGLNPMRVLLDSTLKTPTDSRLYNAAGEGGGLVIFTTRKAPKKRVVLARAAGARVEVFAPTKDGLSLPRVLRSLGAMGVANLLIEGGAQVAASALKSGLVDRAAFFIAPTILGGDAFPGIASLGIRGLKDAPKLKGTKLKRLGSDILIEGSLS